MTDRRDLLSAASKALAEAAEGARADEASREVRASVVASMEAALRARAAHRRRRVWIGRFSVAAALILGVVGGARVWSSLHGSTKTSSAATSSTTTIVATGRGTATALHDGKVVPFDGAHLSIGDRVVSAADAPAEIVLSTGTNLALAPAAELTLAQMSVVQEIDLGAGAVRARVAKLKEGDRFLVRTRDAEVEVRGTVFEVSVVTPDAACGEGTPTRVAVTEGVVVVRANGVESRVAAGQKWPLGCADVAPAAVPAIVATAATEGKTDVAPKITPSSVAKPSTSATVASAAPPPVDALAAKNDLFASALVAKRKGDLVTALAGFESYLAKYPSGELAESAAAQKMSLLAKIDPQRATSAAHEYLARWPNGFARKDAEAILSNAP